VHLWIFACQSCVRYAARGSRSAPSPPRFADCTLLLQIWVSVQQLFESWAFLKTYECSIIGTALSATFPCPQSSCAAGAFSAFHLCGGILLPPFSAAADARVRPLVQRRAVIGSLRSERTDIRALASFYAIFGMEESLLLPWVCVSIRSSGRGRGGGGSRRRRARPTQREHQHPPTHLSEGGLRRRAALR
jgi:hypothetical protein